MTKHDPAVLDFETDAIATRPTYPPKAVGFSLQLPGWKRPTYYGYGHPSENTCSKRDAQRALKNAYADHPILCHNAKFDLEVAQQEFGLPLVPPRGFHDTMFLLFLHDPHSRSLALKPAAQALLNIPPGETEEVRDWLIAQGVVRKNDRKWGRFISQAPASLVARRASGDVDRTLALFRHLAPLVVQAGMADAYRREQRLLPILVRNEQRGVRVDDHRLRRDLPVYEAALQRADAWIRKRLRAASDLNIDSSDDLVAALASAGFDGFHKTPTGKRSTSVESLEAAVTDTHLAQLLDYRGKLSYSLSNYLRPWLAQARLTGGTVHTQWNQVRQAQGDYELGGTRTGRLSTDAPNLLAIAKKLGRKAGNYAHPTWLKPALPELPHVRRYLVARKGKVWVRRDFNQQELRILAHFEGGPLLKAYQENPRLDVHTFVQQAIFEIAKMALERDPTKVLNFGMIYGLGVPGLSRKLGVDEERARELKAAQRKALPGFAELEREIKRRGRDNEPIRTWGGRLYLAEPPKIIDGRIRNFDYKLINYLIQGSAADCTKEALCRYAELGEEYEEQLLVAVHDEGDIEADAKDYARQAKILGDVMQSVEFDVPMLSDGEYGPNWGDLQKLKEAA